MVTEFLEDLCKLNSSLLEKKWHVPKAVCEEINESLLDYSGDDEGMKRFTPPILDNEEDIHVAGEDKFVNAPLRLFEFERGNGWAIECSLWFEGARSDLTMLADVYEENGDYRIDFRMLEVQ